VPFFPYVPRGRTPTKKHVVKNVGAQID